MTDEQKFGEGRMNTDYNQSNLMRLIRASLWGTEPGPVGQAEFEEMMHQAIAALPAEILASLHLPEELYRIWKKQILQTVFDNTHYVHEQSSLPVRVPYVILKGTAAAQYYPRPEYRSMGDIDIMTRREDFDTACRDLLENGFTEITQSHQEDFGRHRSFSRNGVMVEAHVFFALLNDPKQAKYLDDMIIGGINPSHILPDPVNGLVLLEHIDQHFEEGLGLRQIIDWMMFVDKCLPDEKWPEFRKLAKNIGLEQLAVITTRMCEMYMGLKEHAWSRGADERTCEQLMTYVISSGNFGTKRTGDSGVSVNLMTYIRTPAAFFRLLQERGMVNWKAAQRHAVLRPFAWLYQLIRYQILGLKRKGAAVKIRDEFNASRERIELFDKLGVKQISRGLAVYENGEYVKTYKRP